jgi:hypothetical protein
LNVYIIDGHALLAVADIVHPANLGEVFTKLSAMVEEGTLLVTRAVIDVLRRYDPNGHACIWANTVMGLRRHIKVDWGWQLKAQAEAQAAGYDEGMEDILTDRPSAAVETAGLVLRELDTGNDPVVVTEDWAEKPLRPALEHFCKNMGWATTRLAPFLIDCSLGHCVA